MLKGLPSTKRSAQVNPTHEDVFMERYDRLLKAARRMTGEREKSQELVHNAFVQFMLSHPDIASIADLDGYLLIMLRNMNISQARRAAIIQTVALPAAEYDSADAGLRATDAHAQLQVREQLRLICHYACLRKERSKIGSALILRFFHGYYPMEIAQVFRGTRDVVDKWLSLARHEALVYVEDPSALNLIAGKPNAPLPDNQPDAPVTEFLSELRRTIFLTRTGHCPSEAQLREIYSGASGILSTEYLGHLVSCAQCLDQVNALLDLPSLAERFPMETFGRDPGDQKPLGGSGPGDTGGSGMCGGKEIDRLKQVSRRRMKDVVEHRPKELRVAVNGHVLGSQSVSAESNKLALSVQMPERVGFVEVFSEQDVCLMFSSVGAPPDGAVEQDAHVELSEGRTLDLNLNFTGAWPTVDLLYRDPLLKIEPAKIGEDVADASVEISKPRLQGSYPSRMTKVRAGFSDIARSTFKLGFLFRPATVTGLVALLLVAALLYLKWPATSIPTAADLLARSAQAEEAIAANREQVFHRTINLEEKSATGELISRRRVEVWQSAERSITARRLYDERGQLVAGDWRRSDGVQTLYHHGSQPKLQIRNPQSAIRSFEDVWQLSPSAKEFSALIENPDNARLEESPFAYVISYEAGLRNAHGLVKATLSLSRADLHATEQTLFIQQDGELREYHFTEASFERHAPSTVAPSVFDPDVELLSDTETRRHGDTENLPASPSLPVPASAALATAALEVEVIEALNNVGAFTGEQIDVSRSSDGKISVTALVETANRKQALIKALANVKNNPAVRIRIETVAEAEARQKQQAKKNPPGQQPGTVERFDAVEGTNPVYAELRKQFSDEEARRFVSRVLNRSGQARSHALAMKQLSGRFSQADLASLTTAERGRWLALVRGHAERFLNEAETLRRDLQQFFPEAAAGVGGGGAIGSDTELQARARELYDASVAIDRSLNRSLALTAGSSGGAPLGSAFWRQFADAIRIAKSLASAK